MANNLDNTLNVPDNINSDQKSQEPLFSLTQPPNTDNSNTNNTTTVTATQFTQILSAQTVQTISRNLGALIQGRISNPTVQTEELLRYTTEWTSMLTKLYMVLTEPERLIMMHQQQQLSSSPSVQMATSPMPFPAQIPMMGAPNQMIGAPNAFFPIPASLLASAPLASTGPSSSVPALQQQAPAPSRPLASIPQAQQINVVQPQGPIHPQMPALADNNENEMEQDHTEERKEQSMEVDNGQNEQGDNGDNNNNAAMNVDNESKEPNIQEMEQDNADDEENQNNNNNQPQVQGQISAIITERKSDKPCPICFENTYDEAGDRKRIHCSSCIRLFHHICFFRSVRNDRRGEWRCPCCREQVPQEYRLPPSAFDNPEVNEYEYSEERETTPETSSSSDDYDDYIPNYDDNHNNNNRRQILLRGRRRPDPPQNPELKDNSDNDPNDTTDNRPPRADNNNNNNQRDQPQPQSANVQLSQSQRRRQRQKKQNRRQFHDILGMAFHQLATFAYFNVINNDNFNRFMGCYIRCIHSDGAERYIVPPDIVNASTTEIARNKCEDLRRVLNRIYAGVTQGYRVQRLNDTQALLGKILRRRGTEWDLFKRPSAADQRRVYNQWHQQQSLLPTLHQQQLNIGLLKELASYRISTLGLPPSRTTARNFLKRVVPWPNRRHREPKHAKDDGEYEWRGPADPYEPRNCLQNIYDKHGICVGRQSVVRNEWSGLRLVQCKESPFRVHSWYYVPYPEEWHQIQHDFPLMRAFWRADEILQHAIQMFPNDYMLYAETTPQIKAARRIINEYFRYYNRDGSKAGHNHQQSIEQRERRRQSIGSYSSRSSGGSPHRINNNRGFPNWSRRQNRSGFHDRYNDMNRYNDNPYGYEEEDDEQLNDDNRDWNNNNNNNNRIEYGLPHSSPNAPSPNTSQQRAQPRPSRPSRPPMPPSYYAQGGNVEENMDQDSDLNPNQDNAPEVD